MIPCYRSEHTVSLVVDELVSVTAELRIDDYEIILVNDGSPDNVWHTIKDLAASNDRVLGICLSRNFGQHAALLAGYRYCTGDYIVSLDDDGQAPLDGLGSLIDKLEEGYDVVYASYNVTKQNAFRRFGSWMAKKMCEVMLDQPKDLDATSFFIARRYVIDEMVRYDNAYPYLQGLILRVTRNVACVPTEHRKRLEGSSGYSLRKLIALWLNGFTAFSVKPLELGIYVGVLFALAGFVFAIITVIRKVIYANVVVGWSSLVSIMLIFFGITLIMLGLIGEYIGRIYICINNAPQSVIRETTAAGLDEGSKGKGYHGATR